MGTLVCLSESSHRGSSPTTAAGLAHAVAGGTLRPARWLWCFRSRGTALTALLLTPGGVPVSAAPLRLI